MTGSKRIEGIFLIDFKLKDAGSSPIGGEIRVVFWSLITYDKGDVTEWCVCTLVTLGKQGLHHLEKHRINLVERERDKCRRVCRECTCQRTSRNGGKEITLRVAMLV